MQKLEDAVIKKINTFALCPRRKQVILGGQRAVLFEPVVARNMRGPTEGFILRGTLTSMHENEEGARAVHIASEPLGGQAGVRLQKYLSMQIAQHLFGRRGTETVDAIMHKFNNQCLCRVSLDRAVDVADFTEPQATPKEMTVGGLAHGQDVVCIVVPRAIVIRLDDKSAIDSWYIAWSTSVLQVHSNDIMCSSVVDAVAMREVSTFKNEPEQDIHSSSPFTPCNAPCARDAASMLPFQDDVEDEQHLTQLEMAAAA